MALSDWTDKENGGNMVLDATHVYEGANALKVLPFAGGYVIKTLDISEDDLPAHVNFDFYTYWIGTSTTTFYYMYQDLDNYYAFSFGPTVATSQTFARLGKKVAGVRTNGTTHYFANHNLNAWRHWKLEMCQAGSSIYALLYLDDVYKITETHGTVHWSNGAVGLGVFYPLSGTNPVWVDLTKIYYKTPT